MQGQEYEELESLRQRFLKAQEENLQRKKGALAALTTLFRKKRIHVDSNPKAPAPTEDCSREDRIA